MTNEDVTEDRGVSGKKNTLPGGAGSEEGEDVRWPAQRGEHDVGGERPWERS